MTIDTGTYLTFSQIGIREDLIDVIFNISPTLTPFMARIGKTKATSITHEWQTDALDTAGENVQIEGDAFTGGSLTATTRLANACQISNKSIEVSDTARAVVAAGRKQEFAYQLLKGAKSLKRDMEFVLTNNGIPVPQASANSTTGRHLRPLPSWYATCLANVGGGGSSGSASTARTDGSQAALTETTLKGLLQTIYTNGGEPDVIMTGPFNRGVISAFAGPTGTQRLNEADRKTLYATIDVYESDFGPLEVVPNRFSRTRDVHVLTTDLWSLATLREFRVTDIAKVADSTRGLIVVEYSLQASNEKGSGLIADCSTS